MSSFVTGLGVVTPLSTEIGGYWEALCNRTDRFEMFSGRYDISAKGCIVGKISDDDIASMAHVVKQGGFRSETIELASLYASYAASAAMKDAGLTADTVRDQRIAVILGNLEPNSRLIDLSTMRERPFSNEGEYATFNSIALTDVIANYFQRPVLKFVVHNTCASGNAALELADKLIRRGVIDTAIVGAADAFSERIFAGFNALGVLGPERCRPFSKARRFITVSEGAAIAVLQSDTHVRVEPYAELIVAASSNDAHHPTNPSQRGIEECLDRLFATAPIKRSQIDFVYAHGTGSRANDEAEAGIFIKGYQDSSITAIKGTVGHLMGVAGALGMISSCLTARHKILPPNNIDRDELEYPINAFDHAEIRSGQIYVQNNSFGFGGSNSVSIFRSVA